MINISRESEINLINILIDQDIISGKDLANIKKVSTEKQSSQLDAVFELKLTDESKILDVLVKEQSLDTIDLSKVQITDEIKSVLPSNYINMNFVAPFKVEGKNLHIAISDSSKLGLMRNLKAITKKNIELHAAKVSQISEFIQKLQSESGDVTTEAIRKENKEKTKTFDSELGEAGEVLDKKPEEDIEAIENESEVIKFSTAVVADAIKLGVSDIHIEPYRFSSRVRYRLDGMLQEQEQYKQFLHDNYGAVVTRFKIMGKLDIAERRLPQDGAINFKIDGKVVDLRLSILPTANNERIVMRILNKDAGDITLEQLNFEDTDLKSYKPPSLDVLYLTILSPNARSVKDLNEPLPVAGPQASILHVGGSGENPITKASIRRGLIQHAWSTLASFSSEKIKNSTTSPVAYSSDSILKVRK